MKLFSRSRVLCVFLIIPLQFVFTMNWVLAQTQITVDDVAESLAPFAIDNEFPEALLVNNERKISVEYTFDVDLHNHIASIYRSYNPDYAAFVAIDPDTGKVLTLTSYVKDDDYQGNFALGATYPAASLFKMVSAAAAIDTNKVSEKTVIPFNGKSTTLYKSQVLRHKDNKYTRRMPFSEAFARSSNPIFGRLGIEYLNSDLIFKYAKKMGFGDRLMQDLPVQASQLDMTLAEEWQRAEASSGFTKDINVSPVHAAAIAAAIVNDGQLLEPYVVEKLADQNNKVIFQGQKNVAMQMFSKSTAETLKKMMRETTRIGSARKSFSSHRRYKAFKNAEFGGKTGSLSGLAPKGRYGWFVGYGERNGKKIAYASLVVYRDKWVVRPARVAFEVLNYVFKQSEKDVSEKL